MPRQTPFTLPRKLCLPPAPTKSGDSQAVAPLRSASEQELLGYRDVSTTMIYTHVLNRGGKGVKSPVDDL